MDGIIIKQYLKLIIIFFDILNKDCKNGKNINNINKTTQNVKLDNFSVILSKSSFFAKNLSQTNNNVKLDTSNKNYALVSNNKSKYSLLN